MALLDLGEYAGDIRLRSHEERVATFGDGHHPAVYVGLRDDGVRAWKHTSTLTHLPGFDRHLTLAPVTLATGATVTEVLAAVIGPPILKPVES
jgi:hypothetical protein